ncbi:MAG TPA: hypothetical protein VMJ93_01535 [Verrucomicrobiae bacterium]|nr:hypothetical protein [Verrucomicrobiae bacterium]
MPNGRSGGFLIEKADLKTTIQGLPAETLTNVGMGLPLRVERKGVPDILRLIEESAHERISVEEQDHSSYIVHLSNEPEIVWLFVPPGTPVFELLREKHNQWHAGHPNWDGWVGF